MLFLSDVQVTTGHDHFEEVHGLVSKLLKSSQGCLQRQCLAWDRFLGGNTFVSCLLCPATPISCSGMCRVTCQQVGLIGSLFLLPSKAGRAEGSCFFWSSPAIVFTGCALIWGHSLQPGSFLSSVQCSKQLDAGYLINKREAGFGEPLEHGERNFLVYLVGKMPFLLGRMMNLLDA